MAIMANKQKLAEYGVGADKFLSRSISQNLNKRPTLLLFFNLFFWSAKNFSVLTGIDQNKKWFSLPIYFTLQHFLTTFTHKNKIEIKYMMKTRNMNTKN